MGPSPGLLGHPVMPPEWRSRSVLCSSPQTPTLLHCPSLQALARKQELLGTHLPTPGCLSLPMPTVTSRFLSTRPAWLSMISPQLSKAPWRSSKTCAGKSRLVWSLPGGPGSSCHQSHRTRQGRGSRGPRAPGTCRAPSQRVLGLRQKGHALPWIGLETCTASNTRKQWLSRSLVHRGPGQHRGKTPPSRGLEAPQKSQVPSHSGPGVPWLGRPAHRGPGKLRDRIPPSRGPGALLKSQVPSPSGPGVLWLARLVHRGLTQLAKAGRCLGPVRGALWLGHTPRSSSPGVVLLCRDPVSTARTNVLSLPSQKSS